MDQVRIQAGSASNKRNDGIAKVDRSMKKGTMGVKKFHRRMGVEAIAGIDIRSKADNVTNIDMVSELKAIVDMHTIGEFPDQVEISVLAYNCRNSTGSLDVNRKVDTIETNDSRRFPEGKDRAPRSTQGMGKPTKSESCSNHSTEIDNFASHRDDEPGSGSKEDISFFHTIHIMISEILGMVRRNMHGKNPLMEKRKMWGGRTNAHPSY
jgi:hypothetical protein